MSFTAFFCCFHLLNSSQTESGNVGQPNIIIGRLGGFSPIMLSAKAGFEKLKNRPSGFFSDISLWKTELFSTTWLKRTVSFLL
jgi:hypothetical protein